MSSTNALITNQKGQTVGMKHDGYINDHGLGWFLLNNVSTQENVDTLFEKENHVYYAMFNKDDLNKPYYESLSVDENNVFERIQKHYKDTFKLTMFNDESGVMSFLYEYKRKSKHKLSKWRETYSYEQYNHDHEINDFMRDCEYEYHFDGTKWNIDIHIGNQNKIDKLNSIQEFKPYLPSNIEFWKTKCRIPLEIFQKHFNTYVSELDFLYL